jgi:hypothetical protein
LFLWLEASAIHEYKPAYPAMKEFLVSVGRRKFLVPLYGAMMDNPHLEMMARQIYTVARKNYHYVSVRTLDDKMAITSVTTVEGD